MNNEVAKLRDLDLEAESLKARKNAIKQKLAEHRDEFSASQETRNETRSELEKINQRLTEIQSQRSAIAELAQKNQNMEERKIIMEEAKNEMSPLEVRSSMEYRKAFMNYVLNGTDNQILQKRADAYTSTSGAATVIPTTVLAEIVKQEKISGNILPKVRKLNIKGGVNVPTLTLAPTASWVDEDNPSERQNVTTDKVSFSYYGLEVKIAQSLLSEAVSIEEFERQFAILAVEAMTNAKEVAIFSGNGSGKPLGILADTGVTAVTLSASNLAKYDELVKVKNKLGQAYQVGAEWAMAQDTWAKIEGMVDSNGQPVARINYGIDGEEKRYLLGHLVNIVETDRIKDVDTASGTEFYACYGQFNKYAINTNGNIGVIKYTDHDKDQVVTKAMEILDGKLIDKHAFIKIKKGA